MIHDTAVVEAGATVGKDVSIGPLSYIQSGAVIGDNCRLGARVTILQHTSLGDGCEVHAGAVLGDTPQDAGFEGGASYVRIGSGCIIREGVTIHRGSKPDTATEIGDGCFLMGFSHCAHNVKLGSNVIMANGALLAGYVEVGERTFIGGNAAVHQFVKVGRLVMVAGLAAVSKDLPPFCTLRSAELNEVAGINTIGMRRAGMTPGECKEVRVAFKLLYRAGHNVTQAAAAIREQFSEGPALEFCDFIEASTRGICRTG